MRMRTGTIAVVLGVAVLALGLVAGGAYYWRARGSQDGPVAASLVATTNTSAVTNEVIAFFQGRVERDPADFISYTKLGNSYISQARETGDISAYERAETALRTALELSPGDLDASAALATVFFAKHDFSDALALADQVYTVDPGATQALAAAGDARLELGDYEGARYAYALLSNAAGGPAVLSRQSHLADLQGDPEKAIELMRDAANQAASRGRSAEAIAWYRAQVAGLYFNTGHYASAERWYTAALEVFPGYYPALAGLGNVEAARGNDDEAIALYERAVSIVPQPALLATLGDLYARAGDMPSERRQYETVEFIARLAEINRVVYNRELALFYADHDMNTDRAVELALDELKVRKDIYGYDAAAWALYKDGHAAQALHVMEQALRLGTRDARLLFHAGMIERAAGDPERAHQYLSDALDINPHFSVLYEDQARQVLAALDGRGEVAEAERR